MLWGRPSLGSRFKYWPPRGPPCHSLMNVVSSCPPRRFGLFPFLPAKTSVPNTFLGPLLPSWTSLTQTPLHSVSLQQSEARWARPALQTVYPAFDGGRRSLPSQASWGQTPGQVLNTPSACTAGVGTGEECHTGRGRSVTQAAFLGHRAERTRTAWSGHCRPNPNWPELLQIFILCLFSGSGSAH